MPLMPHSSDLSAQMEGEWCVLFAWLTADQRMEVAASVLLRLLLMCSSFFAVPTYWLHCPRCCWCVCVYVTVLYTDETSGSGNGSSTITSGFKFIFGTIFTRPDEIFRTGEIVQCHQTVGIHVRTAVILSLSRILANLNVVWIKTIIFLFHSMDSTQSGT